jgi:endonuclease/exonuclease/phosphatase family metal-dependent hydrolase
MKDNTKKLNFLDKLALWFNYLLCIALLIGYLAPIIDPRKVWVIAFFGLAYPPILLINLIMIVYWVLRWKWPAYLSIITILIGWGVLNNNIGLRLKSNFAGKKDTNMVRMMTYNVHYLKRFGEKNDSSARHGILSLIHQQNPDIIGMQEFYSRKRGKYAIVDSILRIMSTRHYYFEILNGNPNDAMGFAVFSKFPIINKGLIYLTQDGTGNQCLFIDVKKNNKLFRVYSVHLQSIRFDPEDYRYLDNVSKKGKTDMSSSRRIGAKLKKAFLKRSEQVAIIKKHAAACAYPYIISGDFNDTPSSYAVNQMSRGIQNAFREKGSGLGRTYNGDFPNYQIDYIMASKDFKIASYKIIEKKLSDHYPVCSDLLLK